MQGLGVGPAQSPGQRMQTVHYQKWWCGCFWLDLDGQCHEIGRAAGGADMWHDASSPL